MIELLFQTIAVLAYLICGFRIATFSHGGNFHRGYSFCSNFDCSFLGQSVHILFLRIQLRSGMPSLQSFLQYSSGEQKVMWPNSFGVHHDFKIWFKR